MIYDPGQHELTVDRFDTEYVRVSVRTLVDPDDPMDLAAVHALQDQIHVSGRSARPFTSPEYDTTSLDATREALLSLARGLLGFDHTFGPREDVDPARHLVGTAGGWGGLPEKEAFCMNVDPGFRRGSTG